MTSALFPKDVVDVFEDLHKHESIRGGLGGGVDRQRNAREAIVTKQTSRGRVDSVDLPF